MSWQNYINKKANIEGARAAFEDDCATLFRAVYPNMDVRIVKVRQGDGGIDVFIGKIGVEPISVIQCKFFYNEFADSQHQQIRESFTTAIKSTEYEVKEWILCIPGSLDIKQNLWWSKWSAKQMAAHNLQPHGIILKDGGTLIDLFKTHNLYNQVFQVDEMLKLDEMDKKLDGLIKDSRITYHEAQSEIRKAGIYLQNVTNFFGNNTTTHIERAETSIIYNWIKKDLLVNQKNTFILEGEKGFGKTVVLKDLLFKLQEEGIDALGVKADKYYAEDRVLLERKIFQKENVHIEEIAKLYALEQKALVIIIDQLDALSQSLSSNREFIHTYNRLIADLSHYHNVRIVVSTRSFDLNYDAEISIYKSNAYEKLKIKALSIEKVKEVLIKFGINTNSQRLLELLSVPNHLDIFCKLPDKQNFDELATLKDLFDALWKQLVSSQTIEIKNILYEVAAKMYSQQQIVVVNLFEHKSQEIAYIKSNQLLIENGNELQFFHQTFYDYTFSRQFVENKKSLLKYIDETSQSLYVRSVIKMVVDYYREYDHNEYCHIISEIIKKSKYRFHLKNLIITTLGAVTNPSLGEKKIVSALILSNLKYTEVFIGSVFSEEWLKFLLEENIPLKYLTVRKKMMNEIHDTLVSKKILNPEILLQFNYELQQELRLSLILRLFIINSKNGLEILLKYFDKIPDFVGKDNFMTRFLMNVDDWQNEKLLVFFDIYFPYIREDKKADNFWFYQNLEKIFCHYPEFVFEKLRPIIKDVFEEQSFSISFTYEQESLLKKMNEINPEITFSFILSVFEEIIEENKYSDIYQSYDSPLYGSFKFSDMFESGVRENADDLIKIIILDYLKIVMKSNRSFFLDFFNQYKTSNSVLHHKILVEALSEDPKAYVKEIFELFEILHLKKAFDGLDDKLPLLLRKLITKTFSLFSPEEKNKLIEIILSLKHLGETSCYAGRKGENKYHHLAIYGQKKYLFILAIPLGDINITPRLYKVYQELNRKFGKMKQELLDESRVTSGFVGPPLSENAYIKMDLKAWKRSLLLFGDNYGRHRHFLRGGKLEHSRKFQEMVSANPTRFYPFIIELYDDSKISVDYIAAGIDGLIKAKFTPAIVKKIYEKFIVLNLDKMNTMYSIWFAEYIIESEIVDLPILQYLSSLALHHSNPEKELKETDPLHNSLNTVRGAAIHKIIASYTNPELKYIIFETIEKASEDLQSSVKVAILVRIAYLNHLDTDRAFKIFQKITNTSDLDVFKNSFKAASYYRNKFYKEMKPYFERIIQDENLHKNGSVILVQNWINDYDQNISSYKRLTKKSKTAKLEALRVAEGNIFQKGATNIKCLNIFFEFLGEDEDEFSSAYSGLILRKFKTSHFLELFPFMKKYAASQSFLKEPQYFVQFLLKCAKEYPIECLELLQIMNFNAVPNIQKRGYYSSEPVQLVLSVYSSLNNNFKTNKKQINSALTVFDHMLQIEHLRQTSHDAIATLN